MPFNQELPEWNKSSISPSQDKLDNGWAADEKPPASIFNWFFNTVYLALKELQQEAINVDQKGVSNGVATLDATGDLPIGQADNILNWVKGFGLGTNSQSTPNDDLNAITTTGFYYAGTSTLNTPNSNVSWNVINIQKDATFTSQLAMRISDNQIYFRYLNGNLGWSSWNRYASFADLTSQNVNVISEIAESALGTSYPVGVSLFSPSTGWTGPNGVVTNGQVLTIVAQAGGYRVSQYYYAATTTSEDVFYRNFYNGTWGGWSKVVTNSQPTWTNAVLQNSWAVYSNATVRYTKDAFGYVHIEGRCQGGTSTIFTLPVGYRPTTTTEFATNCNGAFGRLQIGYDGNVIMAVGTNTDVSVACTYWAGN